MYKQAHYVQYRTYSIYLYVRMYLSYVQHLP